MDNQHRKITGYRELTQADINLINNVKALGIAIEGVINEIKERNTAQRRMANTKALTLDDPMPGTNIEEVARLDAAEPERWLAMGRTDLQTGLMKLTRAVAQPGFF